MQTIKKLKKSRDEFIRCAIRARKHNDKEKEKQFLDVAVTLNNCCALQREKANKLKNYGK